MCFSKIVCGCVVRPIWVPSVFKKLVYPPTPSPVGVRAWGCTWGCVWKKIDHYIYVRGGVRATTVYNVSNIDTRSCINMHKYINVKNCKPCNRCNYYILLNYSDNLNFRNSWIPTLYTTFAMIPYYHQHRKNRLYLKWKLPYNTNNLSTVNTYCFWAVTGRLRV